MTIQEQARQLVQPASPRYARYDARVRFLGRILSSLRRHRVMVSILSGTFLVLLLSFLSLIGSFFSEAHCQDFVYGDAPACDAKAFLATTKYQYANAQGTPQWQQESPASLGEYRIRGVSKNGFGASKYSNEMTFTLLARDLSLILPSESVRYGQLDDAYLLKNAKILGLAPGDRIVTATWDMALEAGPIAHVQLKALRIEDSHGRDVTECYRIHAPQCRIPLQPQPITVSADSAVKEYDGTQHFEPATKITAGALAPGDRLEVRYDPLPATVGNYELLPSCIIRNAAGEDVTHLYQLTTVSGTLTVLPRPLTIQTGSGEKVYDATPLTNSEWAVTAGTVLNGHTLQVSLPSQRTVVGVTQNVPKIQILDESGSDMTENYELTVDSGTLTITPIVLTLETDSAKKVYDGAPLFATGYRLVDGYLLPGHQIYAYTTGRQLLAGASENGLSASVQAADGSMIGSQGYQVKVIPGILTVTPRPITIKSGSAEKLYDSFPLVCHQYHIVSGSLAPGDAFYITNFTGSQTVVGSSDNTFTLQIANSNLKGQNVTSCYTIDYLYGTLTVKENPDYVPPETQPDDPSQDKDHSDRPRPRPGPSSPGQGTTISTPSGTNDTIYATIYCPDPSMGIKKIYFRNASYGNYTGSGWEAPVLFKTEDFSPLELTGRALYNTSSPYLMEITLSNRCPVLFPYYSRVFSDLDDTAYNNDCYFLNQYGGDGMIYELYWMAGEGSLSGIKQPHTQLEQEYQKYVYSTYLDVPESTRQALMKWAESQGIRSDSPTLIQDIQKAVMNGAYYNGDAKDYPNGVDVAVYFLTEAKEGVCQHFASAATLLYRCYGIPARYTSGFVGDVTGGVYSYITGNQAHAWVEIYQPSLGWVYVEVTGSGGALRPEPISDLTFRVAGATKYYDGLPFSEQQLKQVTVTSGNLLPGHRLEVTFSDISTAIRPGSYKNTITSYRILDSNGRDVTDQYRNITVQSGTLQIKKRRITVASGSATKVDDGTPLTCSDYWLAQGSLARGDQLLVENSGSIRYPGSQENTIKQVKILHTDSRGVQTDVTAYYNIRLLPGTLTLLPAAPE